MLFLVAGILILAKVIATLNTVMLMCSRLPEWLGAWKNDFIPWRGRKEQSERAQVCVEGPGFWSGELRGVLAANFSLKRGLWICSCLALYAETLSWTRTQRAAVQQCISP